MGGATRRAAERPIVKFNPCDACECCGAELETGTSLCRIYGIDFNECPTVVMADQLEAIALDAAAWIAHHLTGLDRDEAAANAAVVFADWFAVNPMCAELDEDAFLARCGVSVGATV